MNRTKATTKKHYGLYIGQIKAVGDGQGFGRLQVYVSDISSGPLGSEDNPNHWLTISYSSPFFGSTNLEDLKTAETYEATQTSYGMWMLPPDIGTKVLVGFANGDINNGFYLGSYPQAYTDRMVPAFAAGATHSNVGKNDVLQIPTPQAETNRAIVNDATKAVTDKNDQEYLRPYAKYHTEGLINQGLIEDDIRGTTLASARRDAPANCYGINTPGPKIENNKRKGGSSFVMDDEEGSESIRIRTRSGAQMLLDETQGIVYFINRDGTSWMEMDADGNVDVFAAKSITMRAEEDFNIRADRNITMEAGQNIYMKAAKDHNGNAGENPVGEDAGQGGDIYFEARNDMLVFAKNAAKLTVEDTTLDVNIGTATQIKTGTSLDVDTGDAIKVTTGSTLDIKSSSETKIDASAIGLKSSNINLETGGNTKVSGTFRSDGALSSGADIASSQQSLNALFNHTHGGISSGPSDTAPFGLAGSPTSATGPGAIPASEAALVVPEEKSDWKNVIFEKLLESGGNPKAAIDKLLNKVREQDVKSLVKRWITREPQPEANNIKSHKKS